MTLQHQLSHLCTHQMDISGSEELKTLDKG